MSMWAPSSLRQRLPGRCGAVLLLGALLAGCAVGPNFERPKAPAVTHYASGSRPDRDRDSARCRTAVHPGRQGGRRLVALVRLRAARCRRDGGAQREPWSRGGTGEPQAERGQPAQRLRHLLSAGRSGCRGYAPALLAAQVRLEHVLEHLQPVYALGIGRATRSMSSAASAA